MVTCTKLNQARAPPSNTLEELEEFHKLSNKFTIYPGRSFIWMSVTDAEEEGVWRDHYTGLEASQEVLDRENAIGGLKDDPDQNCGLVS